MSVIDVAERKSRYRAATLYFFSAMSLMTLWWSMARPDSDFLRGRSADGLRPSIGGTARSP